MKLHGWIAVPAAVFLVAAHALSASAEVRLRIAGQHPIGHYGTTALNQIKADLDTADVGLKIKLFPAGQLATWTNSPAATASASLTRWIKWKRLP